MRRFASLRILPFFWILCIGLQGCGGGGGGSTPDNDSRGTYNGTIDENSPTFDDGSRYTSATLVANSDATVSIGASASFDTVLLVERNTSNNSSEVVAENDDAGTGTDSKVSFIARSGETYTVIVTSTTGNSTGTVTVDYSLPVLSRSKAPLRSK